MLSLGVFSFSFSSLLKDRDMQSIILASLGNCSDTLLTKEASALILNANQKG